MRVTPTPSSWRRSLLTAITGALLWGTWAWFANRGEPGVSGAGAASTQALLAFCIAFFMTRSAEFWSRYGRSPARRVGWALSGTFAVILPASVLAHWAAGTPRIALTIAPAVAVGMVFCALYTLSLPVTSRPVSENQ